MTNCIRLFSFVLCLIILISILPGCTNDSDSKKEVETVNATIDEATSQPTEETIQLLLEEQEYPSVKLNSNFDWESLYYEYLRSLDNTKYSGCALIYINDDDVPELYIKSQSLDKSDMICFVTENGLFVSRINISDSRVKSACLTKRSLALTEQVVTIDKRRIIRKMGNIKLKSLFKIGTALMIGMGLNNNTFKKGSHK